MLTTTFAQIRACGPCEDGYRKLAKALGGIEAYGENTPIPIAKIIETNGVDDALWAMRAVEDRVATRAVEVRFMHWLLVDLEYGVIRVVLDEEHTPQRAAIESVAALLRREIAGDKPSKEEWAAARDAARDAAWDAAWEAAWDAARAASRAASRAAARDAARAAAGNAARDAAWDAAWDAARDAAWDAQAAKLTELLSAA